MPNLSIIIPTYNSEETISDAIKSVISQTYNDYELIIIDGNSHDQTFSIVKEFSQKYDNIIIKREIDNGIYDAMNKGIKLSKGNWLFFLGSDDTIYSRFTFQKVFENKKVKNSHLVYGNIWLNRPQIPWGGKFNRYRFLFENLPHQGVFYNRYIFDKLGFYNPKYQILADKEFNIRIFADKEIKKRYIDLIISNFSCNGISSRKEDWDFRKDQIKLYKKYIPFHYRFIANRRKSYLFAPIHKIFMSQNLHKLRVNEYSFYNSQF